MKPNQFNRLFSVGLHSPPFALQVRLLEELNPVDIEAAASQAIEGLKDEDWELDAMQKRQAEADEEAEASDEEKLVGRGLSGRDLFCLQIQGLRAPGKGLDRTFTEGFLQLGFYLRRSGLWALPWPGRLPPAARVTR